MLQVDSDSGRKVKRNGKGRKTDGETVTVADLARRMGVSRQIVSRQVKALERDGTLSVERVGRKVMVDPAAFEAARANVRDPARASRSKAKPAVKTELPLEDEPAAAEGDTFQDIRKERERYELAIRKLQYERERGLVVPIADLEQAVVDCGHKIVRQLELPLQWAEELVALAKKKGGVAEVRKFLRAKIAEQREIVSRDLVAAIAGEDDGGDDEH